MRNCCRGLLGALIVLLLPAAAGAQVGIFDRVVFGGAGLDTAADCTALTRPTGSFCTDSTDGTVWSKTPGGWVQIAGGGGGGTVTSVGLSLPAIFSVSGSPVTTAGTLTGSLASQAANRIFAGPTTGANAAPAFRALVVADLPAITTTELTDATILFADWADNSCAAGEIPKYSGTDWECAADAGAGSGAPTASQYLTLALDATLTNERVLVGTANQITLTDGGANGNLTLSTPQNIHTGASPTFAGLTLTGALTLPDGVRQTFNPNATTPGLNVGAEAGDPSAPTNGDLWYDSTANELTARINGANVALGASSGGLDSAGITIDGGGSVLSTGIKGYVVVPYSGTITTATALSTDASVTSGSIVVDVWKDTYANYPPVDADSITASAPVTISSATKSQDSTLTGWTTAITAGDILGFNVDSVSSLTRVTIMLTIQR